MHRCARAAAAVGAALAIVCSPAAWAQLQRPFPATALRGDIAFVGQGEVQVNGQPLRLAPGARVRGTDNLIILTGALAGQKATANYTVDPFGLIKDVWILTPEERAKQPWPTTAQEAAAWHFDPAAQRWSKP